MLWYIIVILSFSCQSFDYYGMGAYTTNQHSCTRPSQEVLFAKNLDETLEIAAKHLSDELRIYRCSNDNCVEVKYAVEKVIKVETP